MLAALWFPAMMAASHEWRHGEYYAYGWMVPPAALWLTARRWREQPSLVPGVGMKPLVFWLAILAPWFLVLRMLGHVDPLWRLPMLLSGATALVASHVWACGSAGWRGCTTMAWITLLWLSALPWPSVLETRIIEFLTGAVIALAADWFQLAGHPVEVMGDRLRLHEMTVAVTDGCSGIRSFQSFIMATWFFAELQRLRVERALMLLVFACGVAFLVNSCRACALAWIRFEHGEAAFHRAHDWLGLAAFIVSAGLFYWFSGVLAAKPGLKTVRTLQSR